jgi:hypothetical protein
MQKILFIFLVPLIAGCTNNKPVDSNNRHRFVISLADSLKKFLSPTAQRPYYVIINIKKFGHNASKEICIKTDLLWDSKFPTTNLKIDSKYNFNISLTDSTLLNKLHFNDYNSMRADSIRKKILPQIFPTIKLEFQSKSADRFKTFHKYYKKYNIYLIHALIKEGILVYYDDYGGFFILYFKN